jgi:hypothetical protein
VSTPHLPPPTAAAVPGPPPPPPSRPGGRRPGTEVAAPPTGTDAPPPSTPSSAPPLGPGSGGPPPPPPASRRPGDRGARATAATWVAATGALLLLAAAGTFLAVAWDTMGLAGRVAVVGAVTGAAILGGHRLRTVLPAVGAVVFHLGALLVPVDVLGLTLQLEVAPAGRWLATGLSGLVTFSILAPAGRSKVLAWAAVVAVPVTATGVGLASGVPAALAVALAAVAALGLARVTGRLAPRAVAPETPPAPQSAPLSAPAAVLQRSPAVLAAAAVHLPLLAQVLVGVVPRAGVAQDLTGAGWTTSFALTLVTGVLAVAVLVVVATWLRSRLVAALAVVSAGVTTLLVIAADAAPEGVALLAVPVLALAIELAALSTVQDRFWAPITAVTARLAELVGLLVLPLVVAAVVLPLRLGSARPDRELAVAIGVVAAAWGAAGARRVVGWGWRHDAVVAAVGATSLHVTAAVAVAQPGTPLRAWILLAASAASLLWIPWSRPTGSGRPAPRPAIVDGWPAAIALVITGTALAVAVAWDAELVLVVGLLAVGLVAAHLRAASTSAAAGDAAGASAPLLAAAIATTLLVAASPGAGSVPATTRSLAVVAVLLGLAALSDRLPAHADLTRVVATLAALWAPAGAAGLTGLDVDQRATVELLGAGPDALAVAVVATVWLALDAVRLGRPRLLALAVPVAVRALVSVGLALGLPVAWVGVVLVGLAVAATVAALADGRWRLPAAVGAVLGGVPGWLLLGDDPALRAWLTVAVGATFVAAGLLRRLPVVAHLGGAVTTLGVWGLLSLGDVTATDVWVLPVAAQLWAAGRVARRRGASSWYADVPPLLLVAVPALGERLAGGPAWHALLAGGIGVLAVAAGGARRLGGPLVVGSLVLVAVVVVETLAVVASVPTWAWLALGGCALLGAAVAIERSGTSPVASARRLVDVIDERFD